MIKIVTLNAETAKPYRELIDNGKEIDFVIKKLRDDGFTQGQSIHILEMATSLPHKDAKLKILKSEIWADVNKKRPALEARLDKVIDDLKRDGLNDRGS
jgi:hypothetical protein